MKKCVKGALLSGIIFPGLGQLWLKHYLRGIALIAVISACSSVVVGKAAHQALAMVERMEAEGGTVDMVAVWNTASRASSDAATRWELTAIIACWVVGVVDAYLAGRKADQAGQMQR